MARKLTILLFEQMDEGGPFIYQACFAKFKDIASLLKPWYLDIPHKLFDADGQIIKLLPGGRDKLVVKPTGRYDKAALLALLTGQLNSMQVNDGYVVPLFMDGDLSSMAHALCRSRAVYQPIWSVLWQKIFANGQLYTYPFAQGMWRVRPYVRSPLDRSFFDRF